MRFFGNSFHSEPDCGFTLPHGATAVARLFRGGGLDSRRQGRCVKFKPSPLKEGEYRALLRNDLQSKFLKSLSRGFPMKLKRIGVILLVVAALFLPASSAQSGGKSADRHIFSIAVWAIPSTSRAGPLA